MYKYPPVILKPIILIFLFPFLINCKSQTVKQKSKDKPFYTDIICFNPLGNSKSTRVISLGDSVTKVLNYYEINKDSLIQIGNISKAHKQIFRTGKKGECKIDIIATFDASRLKNFKAFWTYTGKDTSEDARLEYYDIIISFCNGCLWETGLPLNKPYYEDMEPFMDKHIYKFTFDCRNSPWVTTYECKMSND